MFQCHAQSMAPPTQATADAHMIAPARAAIGIRTPVREIMLARPIGTATIAFGVKIAIFEQYGQNVRGDLHARAFLRKQTVHDFREVVIALTPQGLEFGVVAAVTRDIVYRRSSDLIPWSADSGAVHVRL
jgi:hypothetical protein